MGTTAHNIGLARLRFKNWRISTKISVIMVALTVLPLLLFNLITTERLASTLLTRVSETLSGSARSTANVLTFDLEIAERELKDQAHTDILRNYLQNPIQPLPADVEGAFVRLLKRLAIPFDAVLVDTNAKVLISASQELENQRLPNDPWIKAALAGETGVLGIDFMGAWANARLVIGLPIRDGADGPILGAVVTGYDTGQIDFLTVDTLRIQRESNVDGASINLFAINAEGMILSTPDGDGLKRYEFVGQAADPALRSRYTQRGILGELCAVQPDPLTGECSRSAGELRPFVERLDHQPLWEAAQQVMQTGQGQRLRYCRAASPDQRGTLDGPCNGVWVLAALSRVRVEQFGPQGDIVAIAELPENVVLGQVVEARNQGVVLTGIVGFVAALVAVLVGNTLSRPIKRLGGAALKVEGGAPLDIDTVNQIAANGDEIGDLARVFGTAVGALHARNDELRTIYEIGTTISSSIELDKTLEYIVLTLRKTIPYDWAEICLYDVDKKEMHVQVSADHDSVEPATAAPYPADQGYLGLLITRTAGLLVPNVATSTHGGLGSGRTWDNIRPQTYLGVPLRVKDRVVGTVEMVAREANTLTDDHLRLLESVAVQAAVALQNAREVQARESALKQQIQELKIVIDEGKRKNDVAAITESSYFQELQGKVGQMRQRKTRKDEA